MEERVQIVIGASLPPKYRAEREHYLRERLREVLGESIYGLLINMEVESVEIVPAAAGEDEAIEVRFLLDDGQMNRAEQAINNRLVTPIKQIAMASIDRGTRTLFAWCLLHNREQGWVTVPLPPESIDLILG